MLTMNETEAAYARFLSETNCKRLPKTADALFTQLEKQLRTIDEAETDGYFPAIAAALFRNRDIMFFEAVIICIRKIHIIEFHAANLLQLLFDSAAEFQ